MPERKNDNVVLCILREISHKADSGLLLRRMEETRKDKSQRQPVYEGPVLYRATQRFLAEKEKR